MNFSKQSITIPPERIRAWVNANFEPKERKGKNGVELVIPNPLYGNDNPKFNINLESGVCNDWRSNTWAGPPSPRTGKRPCNIVRFVQLFRGISYREALRELCGNVALAYVSTASSKEEAKEETQDIIPLELPPGYSVLDKPDGFNKTRAWNYLLSRGYTSEEIIRENIHYNGANILWFYTEFGEVVYMQSRSVISKKFWFPPNDILDEKNNKIGELEVTKEDVVYGFDDVPRSKYLIIVESIFNKNTIGLHAVASCGAHMSDAQLVRIKAIGPTDGVVLAPDNDRAGLESILTNGPKLVAKGFKVFWTIPPYLEYESANGIALTKDWNELYTDIKLTKPQIVETFNKRIQPFNEFTRLRLRAMLAGVNKPKKGKIQKKK